ncbi:MAG: sigma-B regulation protein RsbQ [Nonlabens sp.]|jgi:sigma-B regulation protein RsbQ
MGIHKRNAVSVTGLADGRPMVFAHGYGCDQEMWRFVAPAFETDHRVVLFDHVGAGSSDLSAYDRVRYGTLDGFARDVVEICQSLDLSDVVLVGHSVSSMIGALAAIDAADVIGALVMISPSPRYINDGPYHGGFTHEDIDGLLRTMDHNHLGWSQQMAKTVLRRPDQPELEAELSNSFCRTDPEIARHFARTTFLSDNRHDLKHVPVPTLVIQVADDALAPVEVGSFVAEQLPQSELRILDTAGHCPHLTAPELTIPAIREFLASTGGSHRHG